MKNYNSIIELPSRLAIFPLTGAVLFPQTQLPLNIFEPRYIQMIDEALSSSERIIGMIQTNASDNDNKTLKKVGFGWTVEENVERPPARLNSWRDSERDGPSWMHISAEQYSCPVAIAAASGFFALRRASILRLKLLI